MLHSEIPPYGHLGDTAVTSLLQPLFFGVTDPLKQ